MTGAEPEVAMRNSVSSVPFGRGDLFGLTRRRMGERWPVKSALSTSLSFASSRLMFHPMGMPIAHQRVDCKCLEKMSGAVLLMVTRVYGWAGDGRRRELRRRSGAGRTHLKQCSGSKAEASGDAQRTAVKMQLSEQVPGQPSNTQNNRPVICITSPCYSDTPFTLCTAHRLRLPNSWSSLAGAMVFAKP